MAIHIYTDGACSGNPGAGGAAWALVKDGLLYAEGSEGFRKTTNNRMEIMSVILGLRQLRELYRPVPFDSVIIRSDSQLVVNTMNAGWRRNSNEDLWRLLDDESAFLKRRHVEIRFEKVSGHSGDLFNDRVDSLAVQARSGKIEALHIDDGYETGSIRVTEEANCHFKVLEVSLSFFDAEGRDTRHVVVRLANNTRILITGYMGGFVQSGGTTREMEFSLPYAERFKDWLNGGSL